MSWLAVRYFLSENIAVQNLIKMLISSRSLFSPCVGNFDGQLKETTQIMWSWMIRKKQPKSNPVIFLIVIRIYRDGTTYHYTLSSLLYSVWTKSTNFLLKLKIKQQSVSILDSSEIQYYDLLTSSHSDFPIKYFVFCPCQMLQSPDSVWVFFSEHWNYFSHTLCNRNSLNLTNLGRVLRNKLLNKEGKKETFLKILFYKLHIKSGTFI